jgi:D-alanyl-D-alanine carboxypeptidase/D-alanyl-D-alanine-endopeptidase (penicillin-binding protein 4)
MRALVGPHESLRTGEVIRAQQRQLSSRVEHEAAHALGAAERLGWDYRFATALVSDAPIEDGILRGDLIVVGSDDPSIGSPDRGHPALFLEWAEALKQAGIRRVDGRLIGDDNAFDDVGIGAGWAWDYLTDGYAAPSGALSYNENVVAARVSPGKAEGEAATVTMIPPGSRFEVNTATTGGRSNASLAVARMPGVPGSRCPGGCPLAAPVRPA